ncbi:hypothetical protein B0H66DRAFT_226010 [Apodospora peruviana]|uniref:Uncharacterized protein n=1 Tax=Apodospora peruviana TaxID=516989 RepID=A0AAE0I3W6_9PEZI|nr:hypothetical protein B0H66DRAFT_226010 [Apodospora peruviana]
MGLWLARLAYLCVNFKLWLMTILSRVMMLFKTSRPSSWLTSTVHHCSSTAVCACYPGQPSQHLPFFPPSPLPPGLSLSFNVERNAESAAGRPTSWAAPGGIPRRMAQATTPLLVLLQVLVILNSNSNSNSNGSTANLAGVSGGTIAGIAIGCVALLVISIAVVLWWHRQSLRRHPPGGATTTAGGHPAQDPFKPVAAVQVHALPQQLQQQHHDAPEVAQSQYHQSSSAPGVPIYGGVVGPGHGHDITSPVDGPTAYTPPPPQQGRSSGIQSSATRCGVQGCWGVESRDGCAAEILIWVKWCERGTAVAVPSLDVDLSN